MCIIRPQDYWLTDGLLMTPTRWPRVASRQTNLSLTLGCEWCGLRQLPVLSVIKSQQGDWNTSDQTFINARVLAELFCYQPEPITSNHDYSNVQWCLVEQWLGRLKNMLWKVWERYKHAQSLRMDGFITITDSIIQWCREIHCWYW